MLSDPLFFLVAIPAVLIVGISKGGFGGGLGILAVPLLTIVIPPTQAAAIMLPILCVMDLFAVWAFRGSYDKKNLKTVIPAAIIGITVGALLFQFLSDNHIKLLIGLISLTFSLNWLLQKLHGRVVAAKPFNRGAGMFFGALSGFTSFSVHAGGPPMNMFLLPQKMDKSVFVGTTVIFFTAVNYTKLIPYGLLGLLDLSNLKISLSLMILAPIGVRIGSFLHHRINEGVFYAFCYCVLILTGLKLTYEAIIGLI